MKAGYQTLFVLLFALGSMLGWKVEVSFAQNELGDEDEIFTLQTPDSGDDLAKPLEEVPLQEGPRLSVDDCVQMALLNNRELRSKDYEIREAQWKLKEAKVIGMPVIDYEFLSGPAPRDVDEAVNSFLQGDITFAQRGKIGVGIPLFTFGKAKLAQELAKSGIASEKEKKIEKQGDVVLKVHQLYYGILLAKEMRHLFEDAHRHLKNEISRRENSAEVSDPVELVRLRLFYYEVLNRLAETDKKTDLAYEGLRIQLGMERGRKFSLQEKHLQPVSFQLREFEHYLGLSRKYNPKIHLLETGLKASETLYRLEKRKIAPDVGLGGFYEFGRTTDEIRGLSVSDDFNDPFNYDRAGVGLKVKGELNLKRYISKVKQAEADYYKTSLLKGAAEQGVELELRESYLNIRHTERVMYNTHEAMKLARQFVFLTKSNVDIGVGDKKDYSDALQAYLISRGRYLESVFNYNVAVVSLRYKVGDIDRSK